MDTIVERTAEAVLAFIKRHWYIIPTAIAIYGMVIALVWPILSEIGRKFATAVANPSLVVDPVQRNIATGVIYLGFIAIALVIGVILLGSVAVGVALVILEVATIFIKIMQSVQRTVRAGRRPSPRATGQHAHHVARHRSHARAHAAHAKIERPDQLDWPSDHANTLN